MEGGTINSVLAKTLLESWDARWGGGGGRGVLEKEVGTGIERKQDRETEKAQEQRRRQQ